MELYFLFLNWKYTSLRVYFLKVTQAPQTILRKFMDRYKKFLIEIDVMLILQGNFGFTFGAWE